MGARRPRHECPVSQHQQLSMQFGLLSSLFEGQGILKVFLSFDFYSH